MSKKALIPPRERNKLARFSLCKLFPYFGLLILKCICHLSDSEIGDEIVFEKVNPSHPDKIADRIAGAIVDLAYKREKNPRIAVEVLIGHKVCNIIAETSVAIPESEVIKITHRIAGDTHTVFRQVPQDPILAWNQTRGMRCGDNGIFKGVPLTLEQKKLCRVARQIYKHCPSDGKYILDDSRLIICQSNVKTKDLQSLYPSAEINPLGDWKGGLNVDTGATNRKLGSDMGDSITGGGLHGKDLSKADVSVNIYAFFKAQITNKTVQISCAIGDEEVDGIPYPVIVNLARGYIQELGGFERFAEWGLVR